MRLNTRTWGQGPRTAVLVHGMMSDSNAWWQVGPALARRGYRVIAVDLPGHGQSPADPHATIDSFAKSLLESVPAEPNLLIAHSMGSYICARALAQLRPRKAVYVDTPVGPAHDVDPAAMFGYLEHARRKRILDTLAEKHPDWDPHDHQVEAAAAQAFDPATAASLLASASGQDLTPETLSPTLMIRAYPSRYVTDETVQELQRHDWSVRAVPGADHLAWFGNLSPFMAALEGWATPPPAPSWIHRFIPRKARPGRTRTAA